MTFKQVGGLHAVFWFVSGVILSGAYALAARAGWAELCAALWIPILVSLVLYFAAAARVIRYAVAYAVAIRRGGAR